MSDTKKDVEFSLKVMVNKGKTKVLFAEVDSSFADVLLSFLTFPLGTIVRILKKHYGDEAPAFGSLSSLYNGLANLDSSHFWTRGSKSILLHPRSSSKSQCECLKLDISDPPPWEEFSCSLYPLHGFESVSMYYDRVAKCTFTCSCAKPMKRKVAIDQNAQAARRDDGVFMMRTASFVISDDLHIISTTTGLLQIAISLGITDIDKAVQMTVTFGFAEVMDLLKASLISSTPLSDIILNKTGLAKPTKRKFQQEVTLPDPTQNTSASNKKKKMILRVMVQKSTNKFLYAQAEKDFVEFLFSFLIIPLGGVECLLAGNSLNKCVDSLYNSVADDIDNKYFRTPEAKVRLIKPKIRHGYISENHILPLIEQELTSSYFKIELFSSLKFPKGKGNYLRAPATFMVTDDLTVTPLSIASAVSFLRKKKIPVFDIKEVELQIGFKEALGILRGSLTSTSALSNGLNLSRSHKKIKQEH